MPKSNDTSKWAVEYTAGTKGAAGTAFITVDDSANGSGKKKFFAKGVAYSPVPAGAGISLPQLGDWFYDVPDQTKAWSQIWTRDLANMQAMKLNVLKTYFFWPKKPPSGDQMNNWKATVDKEVDRSHKAFLDAAREAGIYVLIGVALDAGNIFDNGSPKSGEDYKDYYKWVCQQLATRYGDHPAVMGFVLGNEMNNPERLKSRTFWDINKEFVAQVRENAKHKLVLQAMQNDGALFTYKVGGGPETVPNMYTKLYDLWAVNVFDGDSFDQFLTRFETQIAETDYIRPILFTEYGVPAGTNDAKTGVVKELPDNAEMTADYLKSLYVSMTTLQYKQYCCGGTYFEYCDEWWKGNGEALCDHTTPSTNSAPNFPGGSWEPAWWGLYSVETDPSRTCADGPWNSGATAPYPPDVLTARAAVSVMTGLAIPSGFAGAKD